MHDHTKRHFSFRLTVLFCIWAILTSIASAQTSSGTISGRVLDPAGQTVPGAMVTLTEQGTGETWNFTTDHAGQFVFASIQPGVYNVVVRVQGFKSFEKTGLSLSASERLSAGDLTLGIGSVSETVEVKADTVQVQTASSERSALLDSNQVENSELRCRQVTLI